MSNIDISIIIRTLNESRYLASLLKSINNQKCKLKTETIIVDSGSTDGTINIAKNFGCRITNIKRSEFSFGRSLNIGCKLAKGKFLVIISGHCVPLDSFWLKKLVQPILDSRIHYSYGRQIGGEESYFSENRIFGKYFPEKDKIPQNDYYCNNANSALLKSVWENQKFNEQLTGLEDIELSLRIKKIGLKVGYVSEAIVYHYHHENWKQVKRRFEREAIAYKKMFPEVFIRRRDSIRYYLVAIIQDINALLKSKKSIRKFFWEIILYRLFQYMGNYKGNQINSKLIQKIKDIYYYP